MIKVMYAMQRYIAAAIQFAALPGDEKRNTARALAMIEKAAGRGAQLVCLPELFSSGYDLAWLGRNTKRLSPATLPLLAAAAKANRVHLIAGVPIYRRGKLYNAALLWNDKGNLIGSYAKAHLMNAPEMPERQLFTRGDANGAVFKTKLGTVGMMICFDLRFPELARKMVLNGAELIVLPSAWPATRIEVFDTLAAARAMENQCHLLAVNRSGADLGARFGGHSALYGPAGLIGKRAANGETILLAEIDRTAAQRARRAIDCFKERRQRYGL